MGSKRGGRTYIALRYRHTIAMQTLQQCMRHLAWHFLSFWHLAAVVTVHAYRTGTGYGVCPVDLHGRVAWQCTVLDCDGVFVIVIVKLWILPFHKMGSITIPPAERLTRRSLLGYTQNTRVRGFK